MLRNLILLAYCFIWGMTVLPVSAQDDRPYLGGTDFYSPKNIPTPPKTLPQSNKTSVDTLTVSLPFLDAFNKVTFNIRTNNQTPDSAKWLIRQNVSLTRNQAVNPPDYGVATFDGMAMDGYAHSASRFANTGPADSLLSHFIDLSGLTAKDSVFLTFYVQAGGTAERPRPESDFKLYLRDKNGVFQAINDGLFTGSEYRGQSVQPDIFYRVHFGLDESYLHSKFQLLFAATANLTNFGDVWHLDYVYLDKNRGRTDTAFKDVGIQWANMRRLMPYSACPIAMRKDTNNFEVLPDTVKIYNFSTEAKRFNLNYFSFDSLGNRKPLAIQQQQNVLQAGEINQSYVLGLLNEQGKFPYLIANLKEPKIMRQDWVIEPIPADADINPANDSITVEYPTDSILAYDDGEFESSIGHNNARKAYSMRFQWRKSDTTYTKQLGRNRYLTYRYKQPDTVRAVWLSFYPRHEFIDTFLTFRIGFWKDTLGEVVPYQLNREDTFCIHRNCRFCTNFGNTNKKTCHPSTPFHFYRYPIYPPYVITDTTFLVGIVQNQAFRDVGFGILLGRDVNTPNQGLFYQFESGWRNTNEYNGKNVGMPGLRLEVVNGTSVWNSRPDEIESAFAVYPNPATDGSFYITFDSKAHKLTDLTVSVADAMGKTVWSTKLSATSDAQRWKVNYPESLTSGVYFVKLQGQTAHTTLSPVWHKLILNR